MSNLPEFDKREFDRWQDRPGDDELYHEERESRDRAGCSELFALILWCAFGAACWLAIAEAWGLVF